MADPAPRLRGARGAAGARRRAGHRRLRHRLLVAQLPQAVPGRRAEDRPVVRRRRWATIPTTRPSCSAIMAWPARSGSGSSPRASRPQPQLDELRWLGCRPRPRATCSPGPGARRVLVARRPRFAAQPSLSRRPTPGRRRDIGSRRRSAWQPGQSTDLGAAARLEASHERSSEHPRSPPPRPAPRVGLGLPAGQGGGPRATPSPASGPARRCSPACSATRTPSCPSSRTPCWPATT